LRLPARFILGQNVNRLRQASGLTQEQLAEKTEIDRRYLQRIEKGTANPGVEVLWRLKAALAVEWDDLLEKK
jgi:transcriptional regulator with XRE-family HTH domain